MPILYRSNSEVFTTGYGSKAAGHESASPHTVLGPERMANSLSRSLLQPLWSPFFYMGPLC